MDLEHSGSLLKTVLDRVLTDEAEFATFSRLIYVAKLADEDAGERIAPFMNAFVAEEWARDSNMTGLLVVQAETCLHFVESQPETVVALLHALDTNARSDEPIFQPGSVRIVHSMEDAQSAMFGQLLMVKNTFTASGGAVDLTGDEAGERIFAVVRKLLRLAREMPPPSSDREAFEEARERIVREHASLVPSDVAVKSLAESEGLLLTLPEWLSVFGSTVGVETHDAAAHPMPASILTS